MFFSTPATISTHPPNTPLNRSEVTRLRDQRELRLIRRVQSHGDRSAADTLIRRYYGEIYAFIRRQTRSPEDSRDITQETFVGFLRTIRGYDPSKSEPRTWLYRIASNKLTDRFRSMARTPDISPLPIDEAIVPSALAYEEDYARRVWAGDISERANAIVAAADAEAQRVFRLRLWGGFTFASIAAMLDISENTVKSRYYRMIKTLRDALKEWYDDE